MELSLRENSGNLELVKKYDNSTVIIPLRETYPISLWNSPKVYQSSGIRGYEPMTAKELETEEEQDKCLNSDEYFIEEKFDGTRALVYFISSIGCRVFSRRLSKKTGFYVENTDSLPHLKYTDVDEDLTGTILDGEMFINGLPFKEVSSTLNCLWDKAVQRQIEKGLISFHAFDILFYNGIDLRNMRLEKRKKYLHLAVQQAENPYIEEVAYYSCGKDIDTYIYAEVMKRVNPIDAEHAVDSLKEVAKEQYLELWRCFNRGEQDYLTPKAYYELIVALGGEGVIIKPKNGKYLHKRGWEYSKIKKFLTRDLIITGFSTPTKEYTGNSLKTWEYWVKRDDTRLPLGIHYCDNNAYPVTKNYYYNLVGNLYLGVLIKKSDVEKMSKSKVGHIIDTVKVLGYTPDSDYVIMEVCECSGFDDDMREYFTHHVNDMIGQVVEVKANEIFKDSGKLRHPRFLRMREDKNPEQCLWENHINL